MLDDRPFIVMPYMKNGNARDYLRNHQDFDRVKLVSSMPNHVAAADFGV